MSPEIENLIKRISKLPGLGPRSGRRIVLHLLRQKESLMAPLASAMQDLASKIMPCRQCGNLDVSDPCSLCSDARRDATQICVVEELPDLWAVERSNMFRGHYHVLGGTLSALQGIGPAELRIPELVERVRQQEVREIILATNVTVEGQTTAHVITQALEGTGVKISRLAQGIPIGAELDYLDDGTLVTAFKARTAI
jgi:recombination protein RecR